MNARKNANKHNFIKNKFKEKGCILLSKQYVNNYSRLKYICKNGHISETSWISFSHSSGCCEKCKDKGTYDFEFVKDFFNKKGCKLLSRKYVNCKEKLKYICKNNHVCYISFDNFKRGKGCKSCMYEKISKDKKTDFNLIKEGFKKKRIYFVVRLKRL